LASLPTQIAKYQIVRRLGHGGMGAVYLGRDPDLDRPVAIKVLREPMADEELLQRFLREARAAANLRHENLITIYDVGSYDQQPFIAMEYVDGATLGELIKRRQALPLVQKLLYLEQICAGLHHAHRVGIVHRDIKPANLMVDGQGVIRILDFGIARVANSGMTSDGALIGTLNYMSPEQMLGRPVDFRSDIFSLGAVAYELLAYQQAFPGSLDDGLLQRLPQMPPPPLASVCPGLPPGLEEVVMRALAKAPLERFADLEDMRGAVRHLRAGVDPRLELETIVIPSRDKKASAHAASSAERRELLERRAKQIAVHRGAARAALTRGDLDSASAACDDALTIDPDDKEATEILVEIQQAKERRDQESKARRERERAMRQRVADAEITLGRGDVAAAVRMLDQVLRDEAHEPAALALLDKVREAATAAGVALPPTLNLAAQHARTDTAPDPTRLAHRPDPTRRKAPLVAAAAVVVLAVGGVVVWLMQNDRATPAQETAAVTNTTVSSTTPPPPVVADPPPPQPDTRDAPPTNIGAAVARPIPPASPAPTPTPPPAVDALAPTLARITQLHQSGNVEGALAELARLESTNDNRVSTLARSIAQSAFRSMAAAHDAAVVQKAESAAPASYDAAERERGLADAASSRGDFVNAGTRALRAAEAYQKAESEARAAAALAAKTPAPAAPAPPPRAEAAAAPPPTPTTAPRSSALDTERPEIMRALERYLEAYRQMNVDALKRVYPSLPSETGQALNKQFRNCTSYDATFLTVELLMGDNPTSARADARTTYTCQPKTRQSPQPQTVEEGFRLRKFSGQWIIDGILTGDMKRIR
jgi:serine/threonine-protein kinase